MRQAITTRYAGPTNHRGARVIVRCQAKRISVSWDDALHVAANHERAALILVAQLGWAGHWAGGALELAGEWLAEHAPGLIIAHDSEELRALVRASAEDLGLDLSRSVDAEYRAHDHATADLTYTEAGYLISFEWGVDLEDPSRGALLAFADAIGAEFLA